MACHTSPRRLAHIARPQIHTRHKEMKTCLLQINYANPFAGLDHEKSCTHLMNFYHISRMLGASKIKEGAIFLRWFPHTLIGNKVMVSLPTNIKNDKLVYVIGKVLT